MLELVGMTRDFGKLRAINDINIRVERGKIMGLIGPNGSGKTTLFNLISGFLGPTRGKIMWEGENIAGKPPHVIAGRGIVRTFQLTNVYGELTVLGNVLMACHLQTGMGFFEQFLGSHRVREKEKALEEKALNLLEFMGIEKERDKSAGELPGGTQRILTIATALATSPKLLMLDEPLAGLNTS